MMVAFNTIYSDLEEIPPVLPPRQEPVLDFLEALVKWLHLYCILSRLMQEPPPQIVQEVQPIIIPPPSRIAPAYALPQPVQNVVVGNSPLPLVTGGMLGGPAQQLTGSRLSFAGPPMPSYNQPPQGPPMSMYNEGQGPQIISQGQPVPIYNEGPQAIFST
ncbi:unnamed protein product [Cylicocyclus nassatus]|uniref:Uncharacterized protein n=1 Tax=Cylicocyclus nassatus TaxID=53992 RepID=A0AA36DMZ0_CYLNA|nr:unnamed protein product [Cylicocyclus nassatus]CAJ0589386.1 unnamed protein product [Cylicocyclus nassatus]